MREHSIAVIPGDGIGPEVILAGLQVLRSLERKSDGFRFHFQEFPWGSDYYKQHGQNTELTGCVPPRTRYYRLRDGRKHRFQQNPDLVPDGR